MNMKTYQILWDARKAFLRGKVIVINAHIKLERSIKGKNRDQEKRKVEGNTILSREQVESWYLQHFLNFSSHLYHGGQS